MYRPDDTITHRFVLGRRRRPAGGSNDYANCVRFPYKQPDGTQAWFEGRIEDEVTARGEVWEVTTVPAAVTDAAENPLEGLSASVTLTGGPAGARVTQTRMVGVFETTFTDKLPVGMGSAWTWASGTDVRPATPDAGRVEVAAVIPASTGSALLLRADLDGGSVATALESRYLVSGVWQSWASSIAANPEAAGGSGPWGQAGVSSSVYVYAGAGSIADAVQIRYKAAYLSAYFAAHSQYPPGLEVLQGGWRVLGDGSAVHLDDLQTVKPAVLIGGKTGYGIVSLAPLASRSTPVSGAAALGSREAISAATLTFDSPALITLPAPILLQAGAALLIEAAAPTPDPATSGVTALKIVKVGGVDITLTPADPEGGNKKWTFPGPDVTVTALKVEGRCPLHRADRRPPDQHGQPRGLRLWAAPVPRAASQKLDRHDPQPQAGAVLRYGPV